MVIHYKTQATQKACTSEKAMRRPWGEPVSRVLRRRLGELENATTAADMACIPGARCRELTGGRKGELVVDLAHPYRLIFRPNHDPVPIKPDGGLDWSNVMSILVLDVVDYH